MLSINILVGVAIPINAAEVLIAVDSSFEYEYASHGLL